MFDTEALTSAKKCIFVISEVNLLDFVSQFCRSQCVFTDFFWLLR